MPSGVCTQLSRSPKNKTARRWKSTMEGNVLLRKIRADASFSCRAAQALQNLGLSSTARFPAPAPCWGC